MDVLFDFTNDESLAEYQELVGKVRAAMVPLGSAGSEPVVVAEVIYQAATDGTPRLRYTAGEDAAQFMAKLKAAEDEEFIGGLKQQFGI